MKVVEKRWAYAHYTIGLGWGISQIFITKKQADDDRKDCLMYHLTQCCSKVQRVNVEIDV